MPNELELQVQAGTLPAGACPLTGDYQGLLNLLAQYMSVTFPSTFAGVTASTTPPTDETQVWLQLDSNGRPVRLYYFAAGAWVSQHPLVPGFIMIWPFALPDFTTFDGGDGNAASAVSGPMWQQAKDSGGNLILQAQFPLGVGTLPSGTAVAVGQTGGEENHTLAATEMPNHTHPINYVPLNVAAGTLNLAAPPNTSGTAAGQFTGATGGNPANNNATDAHNTLPPYYGVYFLQRTSRLFYSVT